MLSHTARGLYCPAGDFYIDPVEPVDRAVITHAHADHARAGSRRYLASAESEHLLRYRLGEDAEFQFLNYGESVNQGGVDISLHPAGHILGSAQVRLEYQGQVAVVTGDYKLGDDATCASWEPIQCHLLVTESTFGLPVFRWPSQESVFDAINHWWRASAKSGHCCMLYAYAVGKSQRLLAGLDPSIGEIFTHGAVEKGTDAYRRTGVILPATTHVAEAGDRKDWSGCLVLAVPSAHGTSWTKRFRLTTTAMASGWMAVRGSRRRRSVDRGFVLSDHVDWPSLLEAVEACGPNDVWVTHGTSAVVARYLNEKGYNAKVLESARRDTEEESS
ncbi:MAG: ligase-associated DNA damage response exonuclease [Planctomycetota bacterium]